LIQIVKIYFYTLQSIMFKGVTWWLQVSQWLCSAYGETQKVTLRHCH